MGILQEAYIRFKSARLPGEKLEVRRMGVDYFPWTDIYKTGNSSLKCMHSAATSTPLFAVSILMI